MKKQVKNQDRPFSLNIEGQSFEKAKPNLSFDDALKGLGVVRKSNKSKKKEEKELAHH